MNIDISIEGPMKRRTLLTLLVSEVEKSWLEQIADLNGGSGMSAIVRRLIRREAQRLGLDPATSPDFPDVDPS